MYQWEKVYCALRDAGGFWLTAEQITKKTGVPRVAARILDIEKKKNIVIERTWIDRSRGQYGYRIKAEHRNKPEPPAEPPNVTQLFDTDQPIPTGVRVDAATGLPRAA